MTARDVKRVAATGPWAERWGYARAVEVGGLIEVSGTTAITADGSVIAPGDAYAQTREALRIIGVALSELDASLLSVVRTRVFLRDIRLWSDAGRAHLEAFGAALPASSCIGGVDFLHPDIVVEVEATAVTTPMEEER